MKVFINIFTLVITLYIAGAQADDICDKAQFTGIYKFTGFTCYVGPHNNSTCREESKYYAPANEIEISIKNYRRGEALDIEIYDNSVPTRIPLYSSIISEFMGKVTCGGFIDHDGVKVITIGYKHREYADIRLYKKDNKLWLQVDTNDYPRESSRIYWMKKK